VETLITAEAKSAASLVINVAPQVDEKCCEHFYRSAKLFSRTTLPGFEQVCAESLDVSFAARSNNLGNAHFLNNHSTCRGPELLESLPEPGRIWETSDTESTFCDVTDARSRSANVERPRLGRRPVTRKTRGSVQMSQHHQVNQPSIGSVSAWNMKTRKR
jgi:hypothetical protein